MGKVKDMFLGGAGVLIGLLVLSFAISELESADLDQICSTNNKVLKRIGGIWQCGTDLLFNNTQLNGTQFNYVNGLIGIKEGYITSLGGSLYVLQSDLSVVRNNSANGYDFLSPVHINTGSGSLATLSTGSSLLVQRNDLTTRASGITIISGTSGQSFVDMGDTGDSDIGRLLYSQADNQMRIYANNNIRLRLNSTGITAEGSVEADGTTTTAPFRMQGQKLVSKATVSSGDNTGALEYANNTLYFTNWKVRRTVVQAQEILTANVTSQNTATETAIYVQPHGANYLIPGKMEDIHLIGTINTGSAVNDGGTIIIRYAGSQIGNFSIPKTLTNRDIEIHVVTTVRTIGAGTTTIVVHANADIEGVTSDPVINTIRNGLDSTTMQNTSIHVKWTGATVNNKLNILQGRALSIDDNQQS